MSTAECQGNLAIILSPGTCFRFCSLVMGLDRRTTDRHVTEWNCEMRGAHSPTLKICILLLKTRDDKGPLP